MQIWWQSSSSLGFDPLWEPYHESLKRHAQKVGRPDTKVEFHGLKFTHPLIDRSSYVRYLSEGEAINNAIRAEREGYDAFCVGCMLDLGFLETRDVVNIPVAFLAESSFHLACLLADKFSLLTFSKVSLLRMKQKIRQYGLEERFVPCDAFNVNTVDLVSGFKNPEPLIDAVKQASRKAIEQGAGILLSTCTVLNMVLVDCGFRQIDGVPILDIAGALLKITELMVDLERIGISRSKTGLYTSLSKEELAIVRKSCGVE